MKTESKFEVPSNLQNIDARLKEIGFPSSQAINDAQYRKELRTIVDKFLSGGLLIVRHCQDETIVEVP